MSKIILSTPTVVINNEVIMIIPNSADYTEGLGEQSVKTQSGGAGSIELVFSDNAESKISDFKFKIFADLGNIDRAKVWKKNGISNAISITQGSFSRTISNAALVNNYVVPTKLDGEMELEFKGSAAV